MKEKHYQVAVDAPLAHLLTYKSKEHSFVPGTSVNVPLGKRFTTAVILNETKTKEIGKFQLKDISSVDSSRPVIPEIHLKWLSWLAKYYIHPIGQVASMIFPPLKKNPKPRKSNRAPVVPNAPPDTPPTLSNEQKNCVSQISKNIKFNVHLLHGVTGSGKTEVYLHLLEKVLQNNKRAIVLVPEISLTPQLVQRFAARFTDQIAVIHSHLTDREKTDQWWKMVGGDKKILIGARSALFCPVENIGMIIVDEEHEPSFKQDEKLKYNARDAAIMLAKLHDCPIVLGSATPSLESWKNACDKKYELHQILNRVSQRRLPHVEVVDLRECRALRKSEATKTTTDPLPFWLSDKLYNKIQETLESEQQVALFLNRRGIAQTIFCPDCGFIYECPNCEISLTLHGSQHLVCHYCDYADKTSDNCPQCSDGEITPLGLGTELIENDLKTLFPKARLARADRDEINSRSELEELIENMESRKIDILIGTQMIAKGLDFPGLTLVGVIMADVGFNIPDFRTGERSFQLLTQVSGRAGRHFKDKGHVVIQTYNPEHKSILFAQQQNFTDFANHELNLRQSLRYPPFWRLAAMRIQGTDKSKVISSTKKLAQRAVQLAEKHEAYEKIILLGPAEAPLAKVRNRFRYHLLIKCPSDSILNSFCNQLYGNGKWILSGTKVLVDVDPINMM